MGETECFHAGVVSTVKVIVDYHAYAEACAESIAEQIGVALGASQFGQFGVYLRKHTSDRLSEGEEVAVIIDEYGDPEFFF